MWSGSNFLLSKLRLWLHRQAIRSCLATGRRGGVKKDHLVLVHESCQLEAQWYARDIHPWDRNLPKEQAVDLFNEQLLADTEAAIHRLFVSLPNIEKIDLKVLEPGSGVVLLEGAVHRSNLPGRNSSLPVSARMRLNLLGIKALTLR